ncbi:MAG: hypothetical protein WCL00_12590 [Bacteroidota bacterium]
MPFATTLLTSIAGSLANSMIEFGGKKLRDTIFGSDKQRAIERCVNSALIVMSASVKSSLQEEDLNLIENIFNDFFHEQDVANALSSLLKGQKIDKEEIKYLFEAKEYDPETLPGPDFLQLILVFESAFIFAAVEEIELHGIIQTAQLLKQTDLQREIRDILKQLTLLQQENHLEIVNVSAGLINALDTQSNKKIDYLFPQIIVPHTLVDWEKFYLTTLIGKCDQIDLTILDETVLQTGSGRDSSTVRITDVFTSLNLKGLTRKKDQKVEDVICKRLKEEVTNQERGEKEESPIPLQAIEAIASVQRLVILGEPGGGKSTLVNHITSQMARRLLGQNQTDEKMTGWPQDLTLFPIRIILPIRSNCFEGNNSNIVCSTSTCFNGFWLGPSSRSPIIPVDLSTFNVLLNLVARSVSSLRHRQTIKQFHEGLLRIVPPAHKVSSSGWATIRATCIDSVILIRSGFTIFQLISTRFIIN